MSINNTNNFFTASEKRKIENNRVVDDFFKNSQVTIRKTTDKNIFLD